MQDHIKRGVEDEFYHLQIELTADFRFFDQCCHPLKCLHGIIGVGCGDGARVTGLKRLTELVEDGGGRLSIILAGHPKLRNDLRRPTMEEIGYRTDVFSLDGITGSQREYIRWLIETCCGNGKNNDISAVLTDEVIDCLASKLRTPLQIQLHLALAFEAGYLVGEKPPSEPPS